MSRFQTLTLLAASAITNPVAPAQTPQDPSTYTQEQRQNLSKIVGNKSIFFIPADEIIDKFNPEQALRDYIARNAKDAGWTPKAIEHFLNRLEQKTISLDLTDLQLIVRRLGEVQAVGASALPLENIKACIVTTPQDVRAIWPVDNNAFETITHMKNPERPFPSAEEMHAFLIAHEIGHCDDKNALKAMKIVGQNNYQDFRDLPDGVMALAAQAEATADRKGKKKVVQVYHDPEFADALNAARQVQAVYEPHTMHPAAYRRDRDKNGKPSGPLLSQAQVIEGRHILEVFLNKRCAGEPGCQSYRDIEPDRLYAVLKEGVGKGEITNLNAVVVARGFMDGYAHFEPAKAAQIDAEMKKDGLKTAPVGMAQKVLGMSR